MNYEIKNEELICRLPNGSLLRQQAHPETNEPVTESNARDVLQACVAADVWATLCKLEGIEFDGVMCSATKEDMWGLNSVHMAWKELGVSFGQTKFIFSNGNELVLSASNIQHFMSVWMPFRLSFFDS